MPSPDHLFVTRPLYHSFTTSELREQAALCAETLIDTTRRHPAGEVAAARKRLMAVRRELERRASEIGMRA